MGVELAEAYITLIPSMKGAQSNITNAIVPGAGNAGAMAGQKIGSALLANLKKYAGPIASVVSVAAVMKGAKESVEAFTDLNAETKGLQRTVGGTIHSASQLRGAMQLSGVSVAKGTVGLKMFTKNLSNATANSKKTAAMQKMLGTAFLDSNGHIENLTTLLPKVANKFAAMKDGPEKSALALKLFGRSGIDLLPVLNKGAAGISELEKKAGSLGLTLDNSANAKWVAYRASVRQTEATFQGLKVTIGGALIPMFTALDEFVAGTVGPGIANLIKTIKGSAAIKATVAAISHGLVGMGEALGPVLNGAVTGVKGFFSAFASSGAVGAISSVSSLLSPFKLSLEAVEPLLPQISSGLAAFGSQAAGALIPALSSLAPALKSLTSSATGALSSAFSAAVPVIFQLGQTAIPIVRTAVAALIPLISGLVAGLAPAATTIGNLATALIPPLSASLSAVLGVIRSLLPVIINVAGWLVGLANAVAANQGVVVGLVAALVTWKAVGIAQAIIATVTALASSTAGWIAQAAAVVTSEGATSAATAAQWLLNAALDANPIGLVVTAIAALVAGLVWFFTQTDVGRKAWATFVSFLTGLWNGLSSFLTGVWHGIVAVAQSVWNGIVAFFHNLMQNLLFVIIGPIGTLILFVVANWDRIQALTAAVWNAIVAFIASIPARIMAGLAFLASIPSRVATWFAGVVVAAHTKFNEVVAFITSIPGRIVAGLASLAMLPSRAAVWFAGVLTAASAKFGEVVSFVQGIPAKVLAALAGLGSLLVSAGKSLVNGFLRGIKNAWDGLVNWVKGGMATLRGLWPFSPAKWGPFSGHGYVTYSGKALGEDFGSSASDSLRAQRSKIAAAMASLQSTASLSSAVAVSAAPATTPTSSMLRQALEGMQVRLTGAGVLGDVLFAQLESDYGAR